MESCYNCQKYPLCRVMSKISKVIDEESIFSTDIEIMKAMAKTCRYYKGDNESKV